MFVADLPQGTTEDELKVLFRDVSPSILLTLYTHLLFLFQQCGKVREVKFTQLKGSLVATVEFFERVSVPFFSYGLLSHIALRA